MTGPATLRQCVIPLGDAGSQRVLARRLRELSRFGVTEAVLPGAMPHETILAMAAALPRPVRLLFSPVPDQLDERFLLCESDDLAEIALGDLLMQAARDGTEEIGRILLHPGGLPAGIGVFDRRILPFLQPDGSLARDMLAALAASGRLATQPVEFYSDRSRPRRRALFLDRDGVINVDHGYVGTPGRFEFMPGAVRAITLATRAGWHVFIVTNQSGVARGFYDEAAVGRLHDWLAEQVRREGGTIDDVRYCPYHPEATVAAYRAASDWRKPAPGMILDLLRAWDLDPADCLLVGDQATDLQAAAAAGVAGHLFPGGDLAAFVAPLLQTAAAGKAA